MLVGYRIDQDMFSPIPGQVHIVGILLGRAWIMTQLFGGFGLWRLADQG